MLTCTRRIQFCAGHRVRGHENKCAHLHGHNYVVFLTACLGEPATDQTDGIGRVVDFSVLKKRIGGWIDEKWDHGFIYSAYDVETSKALAAFDGFMGSDDEKWPGTKLYELPYNPTAENLANYLLHKVGPARLDGTGVTLSKVVVWETENCYAEASL